MASLSKAKANFANTWEYEVVEQIVAFQNKCLSLDKNTGTVFLHKTKRSRGVLWKLHLLPSARI